MPIPVTCLCGKTFKVKDELLGQRITCQSCQTVLTVEAPVVTPTAAPAPAPPTASRVAEETRECPACAEPISVNAVTCPLCDESLKDSLAPAKLDEMLADTLQKLDGHVASPMSLDRDTRLAGRMLTTKSIVLASLTLLGLLLIAGGAAMESDGGVVLIVLGVILALCCGIAVLVSLANDHSSVHIGDRVDPDQALKRYLQAARTGRSQKAFYCLAPSARTATGMAAPVKMQTIPFVNEACAVGNPDGFKQYWRNFFKGPSSYTRTVQLKRVSVVRQRPDGVALLDVEQQVASYPTLLALLVLLNVIIAAIVIYAVQKREKITTRKLLIRRGGRWFVAEPELKGPLDTLQL